MSDSSLVRQAMYVQRSLLESGKMCWLSIFKSTLCKTACGQECWDKWLSKHDFELKCERTEYDEQGRPCATFRWEQYIYIYKAVQDMAVELWKADLDRTCAKRGEGSNKLRTCRLFKYTWGFESYLACLDNRDQRILFSKFRIGICPLRIETGRYENDGNRKSIPADQRTCLVCGCTDKIEDEIHFLLGCPKYDCLRIKLFDDLRKLNKNINVDHHDVLQVFTQIMMCTDIEVIRSVAQYLWDAFRLRESILLNSNL